MENKEKQIFIDEAEMCACLEAIRDQLGEKLEYCPTDNDIVVLGKHINDFTTFINIIRKFCDETDLPRPTRKDYKKAHGKTEKGKSTVRKIVLKNNFDAIKIFQELVKLHNENMEFIKGDNRVISVECNGTIQ